MKIWDTVKFFDIENNISDDFIVVDKKIMTHEDFNKKVFTPYFKNKIILETCYPLYTNKKSLILILEKK